MANNNKEGGGGVALLFLLVMLFSCTTPHRVFDYHLLRFWGATPEAPRSIIEDEVITAADAHGIDRKVFKALIKVESGWNPKALSPVGARGLAQVMPFNAKRCGLRSAEQLWDIVHNTRCGARILAEELENYDGNLVKALQAYNGGPRCVGRCSESIQYSAKILAIVKHG